MVLPLLAEETNSKIFSLYDLMDADYDYPQIIQHRKILGHIPIIDKNMRRNVALKEEIRSEAKAQEVINWQRVEELDYSNSHLVRTQRALLRH